MSGVSEGETHVAAMRLVCQSLKDHEQQGIEIQWDVLQQQLDHMDVILQGIADQRNDDAEEIQILRRERDAAYEQVSTVRDEVAAEIEALRKQLADAQRSASDEFVERQVLTAEQDQDAEIWRQQVDAAKAEAIEARRQRNEQTDRLNATQAVSVQQRDEIAYLRARLDEERSVSARFLRKLDELDAGNSSVTLTSSPEPEGQQ